MGIISTEFDDYCRNLDICNPTADDTTVSDRIKGSCPPDTYNWINVRKVTYLFETSVGRVMEPSRLIEFKPTKPQALWSFLCVVFQRTTIETLNLNRAALGLLGSSDERDKHFTQSAYWQNYTIKLYVSMGSTFSIDIQSEQGSATKKFSTSCSLL